MAAVVGTKVYNGELSGNTRLLELTGTLTTNTDTITVNLATHGVNVGSTLTVVSSNIESGMAAGFATLQCTVAALVITVQSFNAAGAVATTFGNIRLLVKVVEPTT
jgi:hypothetical protein